MLDDYTNTEETRETEATATPATPALDSIEDVLLERKKCKRKIDAATATIERAKENLGLLVDEYNALTRAIQLLAGKELLE